MTTIGGASFRPFNLSANPSERTGEENGWGERPDRCGSRELCPHKGSRRRGRRQKVGRGGEFSTMAIFEMAHFATAWVTARLNLKSERGATAVEYGIMVALIAAVIILAVVFLGRKTSSTFSCTAQTIQDKTGGC